MISEDLKTFVNKHFPELDVNDETTPEQIEDAMGKKFILKELSEQQADARFGQGMVKAGTKLKAVLGEIAKGKTVDEIIDVVLPSVLAENTSKISELETTLKKGGKTQEDYMKIEAELNQYKDLEKTWSEKEKKYVSDIEEASLAGEKKIKQFEIDQAVKKAYDEANWADGINPFTKKGIWNEKIEGKVMPVLEDGNLIAYEPGGEKFMIDGTGKKTFAKFVEEILKSDDVKAFKENGSSNTKLDNSKLPPPPPVDKAAAHKEKMQAVSDAQRS